MRAKLAAFVLIMSISAICVANKINLTWSSNRVSSRLNQVFSVDIVAYSDVPLNINSYQIPLTWDPSNISIDKVTTTFNTIGFGFWAGDSFGLNESNPPADGDGMLFCFIQLGQTVTISPNGTTIATIQFKPINYGRSQISLVNSLHKPDRPTGYLQIMWNVYNVFNSIINKTIDVFPVKLSHIDFDSEISVE